MALPNELTFFKVPEGDSKIRILHSPVSTHFLKPDAGHVKCWQHDCPACDLGKPKTKAVVTAVLIQARQHNAKKNGGKVQYHKRVQKKWDKRVKAEGANSKLRAHTKPVVAYLGKQITDKLKELANV